MYCRWCGMESRTEDRCEWCHRPLSDREDRPLDARDQRAPWDVKPTDHMAREGDADLKPMGQQPEEAALDALTKARTPGAPPPQQPAPPVPAVPAPPAPPIERHAAAPAPEEREATPHPDPMAEPVRRAMTLPLTFGHRLEKFLALAGIVTAAAMVITRAYPSAWWPVGVGALFACGLLMAVTRCGAPFEDDYVGVVALPMFTLLSGAVGPLVAPFAYLLVAVIVRPVNRTLVGLAFTNLIVTGLLVAAYTGSSGSPFFGMGAFYDQSRMYVYFSFMLATLGGWLCSSLLLPVSESST